MDRQVRRMVTQRTGEESNTVEAVEPVVAVVVPSDSDEDKNDNVISKKFSSSNAKFLLSLIFSFTERWRFCQESMLKLWDKL
jgi:hypothetical protein